MQRYAAVLVLTLAMLLSILIPLARAFPDVFKLEGYTFLSRAQGPVYPGSSGAVLELSFTYTGSSTATGVHGCIEEAPSGFKFYQTCVQAVDESGEVLSSVEPGGFFKLRFRLDVDRSVQPGKYNLVVRVAGYVGGSETEQEFNVTVEVHEYPDLVVRVVEARLEPFNSPGSRGLKLTVIVENEGNATVAGGRAKLLVPEGFHPNETEVQLPTVNPGSRAAVEFQGISLSPYLEPGVYAVKILLNATMRTEDDVEYYKSIELQANLTVEPIKTMKLEVVDYGWASGKAYTTSKDLTLRVALKNLEDARIIGYTARLLLPPGFEARDGSREIVLCSGAADADYQDVLLLSFDGISVSEAGAGPHEFTLVLQLHVAESGAETLKAFKAKLKLELLNPSLDMRVVDYGWSPGFALNVTRGGTVYVSLQNLGLDTITALTARLKLLNAVSREGSTSVEASAEARLSHGALITLRFPGVVVENASEVHCKLVVEAVVEAEGGSTYTASWSTELTIPLSLEKPLVVDEAHVEYAGAVSPVLPTAHGLTLVIRLANEMPTRVSSISFKVVDAPQWMKVKSLAGCSEGIAPGSTCTLRTTFDVSENAKPGLYAFKLLARYRYAPSEGGVEVGEQLITVPLVVANPEDYAPRIEVVSVFWGTEARPSRPYSGASAHPLTVRIANLGRHDASSVRMEIRSGGWGKVLGSLVVVDRLPAYSSTSTTFYVDLSKADPGLHELRIDVKWFLTDYGARVEFRKTVVLKVRVESYEGRGVSVEAYGWANEWPVYPGTRGAELRVTLANKEPFDVVWLEAELAPPKGFAAHTPSALRAYASRLGRGDTVTLSFKLDVLNSTRPGTYQAVLRIRYALAAGDLLVLRSRSERLLLNVKSPACFDVVSSEWAGGSPPPGTRGAVFKVLVRYTCEQPITVPVARLFLPQGFTSASTGLAVASAAPTVGPTVGSSAPAQTPLSSEYEKYLQALAGALPQSQIQGPAFLAYSFKINVGNVTPGAYPTALEISFLDPWGSEHRSRVPVVLVVSGAPKALEAWTEPIQMMKGGVGTLKLYLRNLGSSSMYNVYVALVPQTPNVAVMDSVKYLDEIEPGEPIPLNFTVLLATQGGVMAGRTATFLVAVTYQDPVGTVKSFNTTVAVIIAPFIDLRLRDVRAEYKAGILKVSGSVVNLGSSTAYRVTVTAQVGDAEACVMLGDIDPGSEVPFRLTLKPRKSPWGVNLTIKYFDEYDRAFEINRTLAVHYVIERVSVTPRAAAIALPEAYSGAATYFIVIGLVTVFLVAAFYILHRVAKRHEKMLEAMGSGGIEAA